MSSGGRSDGAEGVIRDFGAIQQQKINAQNAALAQKNAETQQHIMAANIAEKQMNNIMLMHAIPHDMTMQDLQEKTGQQNVAKGGLDIQEKAQDMFDTKGQVPTGWAVDPNTGQVSQGQGQPSASGAAPSATPSGQNTPAPSGSAAPSASATPNASPSVTPPVAGVAPTTGAAPTGTAPSVTPSVYDQRAGMVFDNAEKTLTDPTTGKVDPIVAGARQIFANQSSTIFQKQQALLAVQRKAGMNADLVKQLTAQAELKGKQNTAENLPKNQQEAAIQLANAQQSGDPTRIKLAQANKDAVDKTVEAERTFSSNLQAQNAAVNKQTQFSNTLAQKGIEDTNRLWTDPQHGFAQTRAQVEATKNVVNQAKNGSELAASLEPAMTVLGVNSFAGVHRISPTEYEAAGPQVGSLYRRMNALLDKAGKGAVPQATLSEVNGIMDALVRGKYQASLDSTRQIVNNAGIPTNRIFVPDPNNYGALTTLDKLPAPTTQTGNQPAAPGSPASKIHASMSDFKQVSPTKEHGNLYTDDGKIWYTSDGTIYGGKK